jgi:4-hydroxy-tetrahydrodipicolinate synthase
MLGYQGSVFNGGSYSSRLFIFPEARVLIRRKDMSIFKGAGVAIVTPMKENLDVNYDKLEELINFHVDNGTDAIIIAGTTGESSTLTMEEHRQVIRAAVEFTKHRIPVVAGTGSNCTRTAIQLTKEAEEDGADAALIVTPYYNKATQAGLVSHYSQIADETKLPIILYNVPGRTGCNLQPETVATLVKTKENIVGLKEATGNMAQASETMRQCDGKLELYSGEDGLVVPLLSIGGIGVISVISNVAPRQTHDMLQAFFDGDVEKAAAMQLRSLPLVNALFSEVNPIPVKKALNLMGMNVGSLRSPLCEMGAEHAAQLEQAMKDFGIL